MAKVSFHHVGYVTSIAPNVTQHWYWNNAPAENVWAFSVDAMVPVNPQSQGATAKVQVTSVEYRENWGSGDDFEKEIHFWVKNTGSIKANYAVHMAVIDE